MIVIACPTCSKQLRVPDELAGKLARCPDCTNLVAVPAAPAALDSRTGAPELSSLDSARVTVPFVEARRSLDELPAGPGRGGPRYLLDREVGRGGMGVVLRAVDRDLRREVAVKLLHDQVTPGLQVRFVEEAQITGQLEHPNIVPIHDLGTDEAGRLYFSMKMVRGRSLSQVLADLRRQEPTAVKDYSLGRLLSVFVSICNALAYAHARGVIHRDLKPANVMLGDFGEVYVMDWGLAKVLGREDRADEAPSLVAAAAPGQVLVDERDASDHTQDGTVLGTPAYMPPEQALGQGDAIDRHSDVYALGAILYEILTLAPPVGRDGGRLAILQRAAEGKIVPPAQAAPERARKGLIPPELAAVAQKALARLPTDRYPSVEALQHDVQRFLEGHSVSALRDSTWELFRKLVKRNKGVSAAVAAALVVLAVVVGFFLRINYAARVRAEAAQARAEEHYAAFRKEQDEKRVRLKATAPAFLRAARLSASDRQFPEALAQVDVALDYDPGLTDAYLLRGQLLIGLERPEEAGTPLDEYVQRRPDDRLARRLAELARNPEPGGAAYFVALNDVFQKQKAFALAAHMTVLAERFLGPLRERLPVYRKRLELTWPGSGQWLDLTEAGELRLDLYRIPGVRDLRPLQGIPLSSLEMNAEKVETLEPLRGMPLTRLDCIGIFGKGSPIHDLSPLRGMQLESLNLYCCNRIVDLAPLHGMPLKRLNLRGLSRVVSLEPLQGMPLTDLSLMDCFGIRDVEPLRGLRLRRLDLGGCLEVRDLSPLKGQPLQWLVLHGLSKVRDFEPLRGMPLRTLFVGNTKLGDLEILREMPLIELVLFRCSEIRDLSPLRGRKLQKLSLVACGSLHDLSPLEGMPLKAIWLTPALIKKGWEVLRGIQSLERIGVDDGQLPLSATEFWKRFDRGEFK